MQIGADIYCDSQCILRELERRYPLPTYFPNHTDGLAWGISRWGEAVFEQSVKLVLGAAGDELPQDFAQDRGRLYFGPNWSEALQDVNQHLSKVVTQIRSHLAWIDEHLGTGSTQYFLADQPGLADLELYYFIWFIRGRWDQGPEFLSQFKHLVAWESLISAIGYGEMTDMPADQALEIAGQSLPQAPLESETDDPQGLVPGMKVSVVADVDGGETHTVGIILSVTRDTVSLIRDSEHLGELCVHFPKAGYRIEVIQ